MREFDLLDCVYDFKFGVDDLINDFGFERKELDKSDFNFDDLVICDNVQFGDGVFSGSFFFEDDAISYIELLPKASEMFLNSDEFDEDSITQKEKAEYCKDVLLSLFGTDYTYDEFDKFPSIDGYRFFWDNEDVRIQTACAVNTNFDDEEMGGVIEIYYF